MELLNVVLDLLADLFLHILELNLRNCQEIEEVDAFLEDSAVSKQRPKMKWLWSFLRHQQTDYAYLLLTLLRVQFGAYMGVFRAARWCISASKTARAICCERRHYTRLAKRRGFFG